MVQGPEAPEGTRRARGQSPWLAGWKTEGLLDSSTRDWRVASQQNGSPQGGHQDRPDAEPRQPRTAEQLHDEPSLLELWAHASEKALFDTL
jgi:hypothetical protein